MTTNGSVVTVAVHCEPFDSVDVIVSVPASVAEYVAEDNTRRVPVMLHRAIVGSLERFIGILIENYAGALPLWLAPVQVAVLTITDRQAALARDEIGTDRDKRDRLEILERVVG